MKNTFFALVGAMLLLTACNTNDPTKVCPVAGRTYAHILGDETSGCIYDTIYFYKNGKCKDVSYFDDQLSSSYDVFYTMKDTTITLYWDKRHKELNYYNGTFFYHDTILIRWLQNSATRDDYHIYTEVK